MCMMLCIESYICIMRLYVISLYRVLILYIFKCDMSITRALFIRSHQFDLVFEADP